MAPQPTVLDFLHLANTSCHMMASGHLLNSPLLTSHYTDVYICIQNIFLFSGISPFLKAKASLCRDLFLIHQDLGLFSVPSFPPFTMMFLACRCW